MFGISFAEFLIIFLLILIVMGPEKIPEAARWAGKGLRELRKASNTLRNTLAMDELDIDSPPKKRRLRQERSATSPASSDTSSPVADSGASDVSEAATPEATSPSPREGADADVAESTSPPATGLDQVDDRAFEQMLEERYAAQTADICRVDLSPFRDTDDTVDIPLDASADTSGVHTISVALPALPTAQFAS